MKTKRAHKYPDARAPGSGRKPGGSGPLFEIRTTRGQSQAELAPLLSLSRAAVARAEVEGRAPGTQQREARHILLNMALAIPEPERSPELDAWIAEQQAEFEKNPLGGVFR